MKTCPSCRRAYEDDSLVFCLDDGTRLVRESAAPDANATWNLPPPGPTVASPRPTTPTAQSTITSRPEQFQKLGGSVVDTGESRKGVLPWVFAIVVVLAASGVLIAWLMTRGGGDVTSKYPAPTPIPSIIALPSPSPAATAETKDSPTPEKKPTATPERPPMPTPTKEHPKPMFSMVNNMTFQGSRITYYQRTSFALCQADCAANANCKGLTWVRPGAYNPGDAAMCYLMASVGQKVAHVCCISAFRN